MAREITVNTWCDRHLAEKDERVPGSTITIAIDGQRAREIDFCIDCRDEILTPAINAVETYGHLPEPTGQPTKPGKTRATRPAQAARPAPNADGRKGMHPEGPRDMVCLFDGVPFASGSGLTRHLRIQHQGSGVVTPAMMWGQTCPLCGHESDGTSGIGGHTIRAHQMTSGATFTEAEQQGDPYGVVAAQRALISGQPERKAG